MSNGNRMPTEQEWAEWLDHPATKSLRKWASQQRLELQELWASGVFSAAFEMEMAVKNAGATGACSVFKDVIELNYHQIAIGAADEEQVRT
jgi:hypothetical protein